MDDFNTICSSDDHEGSSFAYYSLKEFSFNSFIAKKSLLEVNFVGADFNYLVQWPL